MKWMDTSVRACYLIVCLFLVYNSVAQQRNATHKTANATHKYISNKPTLPPGSKLFFIKSLGVSAVVDTSNAIIRMYSEDVLDFVTNDDPPIYITVEDSTPYMEEKQNNAGRPEYKTDIGAGIKKLERFYDTITVTINGRKYWKVKSTLRDVPFYWSQMEAKEKLTSAQLVDFLKYDRASWADAVYSVYYYTTHPVNKKIVGLSVGYEGNDKSMEGKVEKLIASLRFK